MYGGLRGGGWGAGPWLDQARGSQGALARLRPALGLAFPIAWSAGDIDRAREAGPKRGFGARGAKRPAETDATRRATPPGDKLSSRGSGGARTSVQQTARRRSTSLGGMALFDAILLGGPAGNSPRDAEATGKPHQGRGPPRTHPAVPVMPSACALPGVAMMHGDVPSALRPQIDVRA